MAAESTERGQVQGSFPIRFLWAAQLGEDVLCGICREGGEGSFTQLLAVVFQSLLLSKIILSSVVGGTATYCRDDNQMQPSVATDVVALMNR